MSITKKDIRHAFAGYENYYYIHTVKRGVAYVIQYYYGFPVFNMVYNSLLKNNISKLDTSKKLFSVGD